MGEGSNRGVGEEVPSVVNIDLELLGQLIKACKLPFTAEERLERNRHLFAVQIAVEIDGKRLHELAREGKEVERPPRPVRVDRFDVAPVEGEPGVWRCSVDCSSGTYIRSLAADLGRALGGGAHLRSLRRTAVGGYRLSDAGSIESPNLLPVSAAVRHLAAADVDDETAVLVGHGRILTPEQLGVTGAGPWAVCDAAGELLAVYETHPKGAKPSVVIPR